MRSTLSALLLVLLAATCKATITTGLKTALQNGQIKVAAVSSGQNYHSKALRLQISNATREAIRLKIDPALIFRPDDTSYQNLVLPAEEMLALAPGGKAEIEVQTFCGKLHASAPGKALSYRLWKQGDSTMIKVTQYIRRHALYDDLGQQAIWALTDHHNLDGIIDPARPKESAELLALMKKETGWETPEYFKMYKLNTVAGQPVFQKRILKIVANMEWKLDAPASVSLGIYNQTGGLVQGVLEEKIMARGGYKMLVQFEAEGAPPGRYFVRLIEGDKLKKEIEVKVD